MALGRKHIPARLVERGVGHARKDDRDRRRLPLEGNGRQRGSIVKAPTALRSA